MNCLEVNQYAVCARCVRRSEPPISHDVFGQDVVVDALEPGDGMTVGRLEAVEDDAAPKP